MPAFRRTAVSLLFVVGCQNPENRAAKERVFSPPPPDPVVERAKERIDVGRVASDEKYRLRVFGMLFPEVRARAGAGKFDSVGKLTLARGGPPVTVHETGRIRFNTEGDMDVELKTGPTESMQLTFANEVLYFRNRSGAWRISRDPTDERHYWADATYSSLRSVTEMFNSAMTVTTKGHDTVDGRKGTLLELSFKGAPKDPGVLGDLADGGMPAMSKLPDGGTLFHAAQDRRRALAGGEPQAISGTVVLDDELGIPLKVDVEATMKLPGRRTTETGTMTLKHVTTLTGVGKDTPIDAPKEAVDEIVRRRTPVNPLEFWTDGGAAAAATSKKKPGKEPLPAAPEEEEPE